MHNCAGSGGVLDFFALFSQQHHGRTWSFTIHAYQDLQAPQRLRFTAVLKWPACQRASLQVVITLLLVNLLQSTGHKLLLFCFYLSFLFQRLADPARKCWPNRRHSRLPLSLVCTHSCSSSFPYRCCGFARTTPLLDAGVGRLRANVNRVGLRGWRATQRDGLNYADCCETFHRRT